MAGTLITAPTWPRLQRRLLEDLGPAGGREPLAPQWLIVPSSSVANHLRVQLATGATSSVWAGVRVINLPRFAAQLSLALSGRLAPSWHPLLDLTLFELADQLPPESPLAGLRQISGSPLLLRETFIDLAEGGFGVEDLAKVAALAAEPDLTPRGQALLRLYARWVRRLQQDDVLWGPLVLQLLPASIEQASDAQLAGALGAEPGQSPRVFLYGFYEWIDVHLEWLAALARRVPTRIYYPWQDGTGPGHAAFSFAQSVLEDLRGRLELRVTPAPPADAGDGVPPTARTERVVGRDAVPGVRSSGAGWAADSEDAVPPHGVAEFFLNTFPEGEIGPQPEFLSWQRASGVRAEAISAAVRIRRWLDDPQAPLRPADILVVAPAAEGYVEAIAEVFRAFAIPVRVSGAAAGPVPADEPRRMLARIWEEQAPAEWILALLRACPAAPAAQDIDLEQFEDKVRALGIWGGTAWRAALEHTEFEPGDGDELPQRRIRFAAAEKRLIGEIQEFVPAAGTSSTLALSVAEALARLRRLSERWLEEPSQLAPLLAAVEIMAGRAPGLRIELRQWTRLLAEGAAAQTLPDPLTEAVLFTPLMRARGLTAKAVVMLGLAAGQWPRRVAEDPLLPEGAALKLAQVAAQIGHRLPLKIRVSEEMLLLFFLINTAAERVHWVVPESDADGKSLAPTPWIQRYLQRWEKKEPGTGKTDRVDAVPPTARTERVVGRDAVPGVRSPGGGGSTDRADAVPPTARTERVVGRDAVPGVRSPGGGGSTDRADAVPPTARTERVVGRDAVPGVRSPGGGGSTDRADAVPPTARTERVVGRDAVPGVRSPGGGGSTDRADAVPPTARTERVVGRDAVPGVRSPGGGGSTDRADAVPPDDLFGQRIARSPALQARYLAALEPRGGAYLPPELALVVDPALAARGGPTATETFLLESVRKRGVERAWSGDVGAEFELPGRAVSVTRLEALARCPFRFYADTVAGWQPLTPLSLTHNLDALARGALLHRLLEQAVRPHLKQQPLADIAASLLADDARALNELAQRLPRSAPDAAAALAMLLPVFQQAGLRAVVGMAINYFAAVAASPAVPQQVEETFTRAFPGLGGISVKGKIDRLDRLGGATELVDYKSGKYPADYRKRARLGWQIQAALYPWLCQRPAATFRYVFLGKNRVDDGDAAGAPSAEQLLSELAPILEQGTFIPTSNQTMAALGLEKISPCEFCPWTSACRRFDPGSAAQQAKLFQEVAAARCAALVKAVERT